jgi:hypothetical protein
MKDGNKKEERSEYVTVYVTPILKKEFELAKDNQTLKETILKRYLTSEKDWLECELKEIEESTIKYSAKLIGIKEAFSKCNTAYCEEIEAICVQANDTFRKIDTIADSTRKSIESTKNNLSSMLTQISNIDFRGIERLLELINKVNSMSNSELELMKKILNS